MVEPDVLVRDVPQGNASIHRRAPQELDPLLVTVREIHPEIRVKDGDRILVGRFGPGHHVESALPGAQTLQNHPFLQTNRNGTLLRDGNLTDRVFLLNQCSEFTGITLMRQF